MNSPRFLIWVGKKTTRCGHFFVSPSWQMSVDRACAFRANSRQLESNDLQTISQSRGTYHSLVVVFWHLPKMLCEQPSFFNLGWEENHEMWPLLGICICHRSTSSSTSRRRVDKLHLPKVVCEQPSFFNLGWEENHEMWPLLGICPSA